MKITLVRHGDVDENYHRCYNGHIDIGLSKQGEQEAMALANLFSKREVLFDSEIRLMFNSVTLVSVVAFTSAHKEDVKQSIVANTTPNRSFIFLPIMINFLYLVKSIIIL